MPFRQKIKHIWKFWKYPFEFASLAALTQSFAWATFSGPDTASALGEAINVDALTSNDHIRYAETAVGIGGLFASSVGFISEAERTPEPPKQKGILRSLRNDFNGVAGFVNNRARALTFEELLVHRGLSTAFTNGCIEISFAGPNRVAAKTWNTVLYPWAAESLYYQDWNNLKAFAFYRTCNWFFERSTKRTVAAAPVPT